MTKTNSRLMIAGLLPSQASEAIEFIQRQYETRGWHITMPPHITLVRPGTALVDEPDAIRLFDAIKLDDLVRPGVSADSIATFLNSGSASVVYLRVEPTAELVGLHERLHQGALEFIEDNTEYDNFVPHVTLANEVADMPSVDRIVDELTGKNLALDFTLGSVHLFRKNDDDRRWVELASRPIG